MGAWQGVFRISVLAAALAPTCVQAADPPLLMAPASAWVFDRAEDSCAVRRAFQAGGDQVLLELRQFRPGEGFQVTLVSDTLSPADREPRVRFEPDDDFHEPAALFVFDQGTAHGILYNDSLLPNRMREAGPLNEWPEAEREARELAITGLSVTGAFKRDLTLQTGRMFLPMADLRDCMDELLERWGMDANIQHTLTRPAVPVDAQSWVRRVQERYPARQLNVGRSGIAMIRLIVGVDGKPTSCITNKDAPDHEFDEQACEIVMRYARFEPALDANGAPTESLWTTTIVYVISR